MKILKIKINLITKADGIVYYSYPVGYDSKKINILAYSNAVRELESTVRYCIGAVADEAATIFLQTSAVIEIDKKEAQSLGESWRPAILKITNEQLVIKILKKIRIGIPLVYSEIKALDPDDDKVLGINYSRSFNINEVLD